MFVPHNRMHTTVNTQNLLIFILLSLWFFCSTPDCCPIHVTFIRYSRASLCLDHFVIRSTFIRTAVIDNDYNNYNMLKNANDVKGEFQSSLCIHWNRPACQGSNWTIICREGRVLVVSASRMCQTLAISIRLASQSNPMVTARRRDRFISAALGSRRETNKLRYYRDLGRRLGK